MAIEVPSPVTNQVKRSAQPLIGPSPRVDPNAFGAEVGAALGQFGGAVNQLGQMLEQERQKQNRFDALRKFSEFQTQVNDEFTKAQRDSPENLANFSELFRNRYAEMEQEFISGLDPQLQQEFAVRTGDLGENVAANSMAFQLQQTDTHYKTQIADAVLQQQNELAQNGTVEDLDASRAQIDELINSSGLTDADKLALQRSAYRSMEAVVYKQEQLRRLTAEAAGGSQGPAQSQAIDLMSITSGNLSPQELEARAREGEQAAVRSIGSIDTWSALPSRVRASLIAAAADYNGLPDDVVAAVKSGDLDQIAEAVGKLPTPGAATMRDNITTPGASIDDDPRFAMLPYEDRLALTQDAQVQVAKAMAEAEKQRKAVEAFKVNDLLVGIYDGTKGQYEYDQAREEGWLSDINDIEKANKLLDEAGSNVRMVQMVNSMRENGLTVDPMDPDMHKALNAWVGKEGIARLQLNDSNYATHVLIPFVLDMKDIPTDTANLLSGMIRAPDPKRANWALDLMQQLQEASPEAYRQRIGESDREIVEFWRTHKDYLPQDELMRTVRGGLTEEERRRNKELRDDAKSILLNEKDYGLTSFIQSAFGNATPMGQDVAAWAGASFMSDFREHFTDAYAMSGNVEKAKGMALKSMQDTWGVVQIGGQTELMKYPPTQVGYQPVDGSFQWIEDQVLEEQGWQIIGPPNAALQLGGLAQMATVSGFVQGVTTLIQEAQSRAPIPGRTQIQSFQLISDEQTKDEVQSQAAGWLGGAVYHPSYMVAVTDMDGNTKLLFDEKGLPLRKYFVPTAETRARQLKEFQERRQLAISQEDQKKFVNAIEHSLETGIPIPEDFSGSGIRDTLMGGPDANP